MPTSSEPFSPAAKTLLHDPERVQAARRYGLRGETVDAHLQRTAEVAAALASAPLAVVALVDDTRQCLRGRVGVSSAHAPLDGSFAAHVVRTGAPVVVERAQTDPRFAEAPFVAAPPHAQFLAGVPLCSPDGHTVGALCIMDAAERTVSSDTVAHLEALAAVASGRMDRHRASTSETQIRDALQDKETRLQGLTDAIPGVVFQFYSNAEDYGLRFVSAQSADVLGLDPAPEDFFERFSACIPGEHRSHFLASVEQTVAKRVPWDFEMPFCRPDGRQRWVHGRSTPEVYGDEVVYNGMLLDVTERVESQQRFQQFAEQTNDIISLHSADGTYLYASPATQSLLGYAPDELIGRNAFAFIHPEDHDHVQRQQLRALDGSDVRFDYRLVRADGQPLWVETTGSIIRDHDGSTVQLFAATRSIDARKQSERALKASRRTLEQERQWLKMAVLGGDLGLWDCNYNTGQNIVNARWASMLGYTLDEVEPTLAFFKSLVHPDDLPTVLHALETYVAEGRPFMESECRMKAADGSWRWILSRGRIVEWNDDGSPLRAVGTHMDLTDRKRQENALRESKIALEQAQHITKTGNFTWALGANAITLSTEAGNLFGLDASMPHTPDDLLRLVLPNDRPLVQEHLACLRAGEQHDVEYRLAPARTDGSEAQAEAQVRWLRGRGRPEYDDTGAVVRVLGTLADVTAQKRQASIEQRFGRLLDAASSGIYIFRADTLAVEQVNSGAQQNLGYTAKALQNMTLLDIQPCTEDAFRNRARPLVDGTASMLVFETTHRRADGSTYPVEVRLQLSDRETPAVFIAIATDITTRKQYEAGLIEAKERAEEASRIKSAVVANMSHEVRTPLTAIIGFSEVLEEEIRDEQKRRFASRIQQSSKRLLATLNSVLHLSRLEAERQPLTHVTVDAVDVIREVTSAYAAQAQKKQVGLSAHTPASCRLLSDVDMLSRILTNLVSNAIKFTPAGGSVDVHAERPDASTVRFIVADTGIGMSTAFQRRMFEAFEQESTGTDRQHEGSGLGLTIVKRLVDLLGGTLDVRSQKGEGSAFSVTLPRQPPRASRLPPEGPPERP